MIMTLLADLHCLSRKETAPFTRHDRTGNGEPVRQISFIEWRRAYGEEEHIRPGRRCLPGDRRKDPDHSAGHRCHRDRRGGMVQGGSEFHADLAPADDYLPGEPGTICR